MSLNQLLTSTLVPQDVKFHDVTVTGTAVIPSVTITTVNATTVNATTANATTVNATNVAASAAVTAANVTASSTVTAATVVCSTLTIASQTYTPIIAFGGVSTGITYTTQTGRYTLMAGICFVTIHIALSSKGAAVGNAEVTLPGAASASGFPRLPVIYVSQNNATTAWSSLIGTPSTSVATLYRNQSITPGAAIVVTDAALTNTTEFIVQGFYYTA